MYKTLAIYSLVVIFPLFQSSCSSQMRAETAWIEHSYLFGTTAYLDDSGIAHAPAKAPQTVHAMVAAANSISKSPFKYGGGRKKFVDNGYDSAGATSFVLKAGGILDAPIATHDFFHYGVKGYGEWMTLYIHNNHVFIEIAGLRFDTGCRWGSTGPRWKPESKSLEKYFVRHPRGL